MLARQPELTVSIHDFPFFGVVDTRYSAIAVVHNKRDYFVRGRHGELVNKTKKNGRPFGSVVWCSFVDTGTGGRVGACLQSS